MIWSSSIFLVLLICLFLWLPQNIHHEGSHAIAAKLLGAKEVSIYPFPKWEGGWLPKYFAYMQYSFEHTPSNKARATISIAPQLTSTFWLVILITIIALASFPTWLYAIMVAFALVNFIDAAVNFGSIFRVIPKEVQDVWNFIEYSGVSLTLMRILVIIWYLIFGTAILFPWYMLS